ncbi:hypothetical protein [Neisseria sp.]|uniref:hypothetical protein n=1 Tax=Neisseria sp. TaxID=192066 RepID=UPI00359F16E1
MRAESAETGVRTAFAPNCAHLGGNGAQVCGKSIPAKTDLFDSGQKRRTGSIRPSENKTAAPPAVST